MHIEENAKQSWTCWQTDNDDGIAEPALLIEDFYGSNIIGITQGNNRININYQSIDELCKHLKSIIKNKK